MSKKRKSTVWWVALFVALAGLIGYLMVSEVRRKQDKGLDTKKPPPAETEAALEEGPGIAEEKKDLLGEYPEEKAPSGVSPEEDYCTRIGENTAEFFQYLDGKNYFRHLSPDVKASVRFMKMLNRLAAQPPIPAGEGIDPGIIIRNMYCFFRVLDRKDLRLIKEVIVNEEDTAEFNLEMLYRWLTLGNRCPDPEGLRPPMQVVYQYAGFFLNTIGGRAYLFRRSPSLRLLVSYYSLLIVHEAERMGKNDYGIDIFPYIAPLKYELKHYPDLQFQSDYINQLNEIENYYLQRR